MFFVEAGSRLDLPLVWLLRVHRQAEAAVAYCSRRNRQNPGPGTGMSKRQKPMNNTCNTGIRQPSEKRVWVFLRMLIAGGHPLRVGRSERREWSRRDLRGCLTLRDTHGCVLRLLCDATRQWWSHDAGSHRGGRKDSRRTRELKVFRIHRLPALPCTK